LTAPDDRLEAARRAAGLAEGWLTDHEGELLYALAVRSTGAGAIVEIGSWKGKSSIWLGHGSKAGRGGPVFAVDPHIGWPGLEGYGTYVSLDAFRANIHRAGVGDVVVPLVMTSAAAAASFDRPVELVFIDGDHTYEATKSDFELWFPRVVEGGTMAFHDTVGKLGSKRFVEEHVYRSNSFVDVRFTDSITYARKRSRAPRRSRVKNYWMLLLKRGVELGYSARLPAGPRRLCRRLLRLLQG
jgi:predicted O-methyltransferase YrrM